MDRKYFKEYQHLERNHWWFKARQEILASVIEKNIESPNGLKILNVGVSTGYSSVWLSKYGVVKSVEYDKECFDFVKETMDLDIVNASIEDLPFEEDQFDLVCAFDVIEHIDHDQVGVDEMFRVCKPEGQVFVSVPAFKFMWSEHDDINHHKRRYTLTMLSKLFQNRKIIFRSYFNSILFFPIAFFRVISTFFKNLINKNSIPQSDFKNHTSNGFIQNLLFGIFRSEKNILKNSISLPFGVSILLISKK